jgi:hypothetical protein
MGQKMLQCDGACRISGCAPDHKAGQQFAQRRFEVELPALDEEHGCCCGRYNLCQTRHVIHGLGGNGGRGLFIGEPPQSPLEHDVIASQDAKGAAWEGARRDGVLQDAEGGGKTAGVSEGFLSGWRSLRGHRFLVG